MKERSFAMNLKQVELKKNLRRCAGLYIFVLIPMITVFIFHYIPIYGVQMAFRDYSTRLGMWESPWVGLKYFKKFINYPYFGKIMWNTIRISLYELATFPFPIIFALMINELRNGKFKKSVQTLTYAPHFVSTVVTCSMVLLFLRRDGLINIIAGAFGIEPSDIISKPEAFAPIFAISGLWQGLGWGTIIYTASLAGVSPDLVEAAEIDGANRMRIIWHIYLPHLRPTIITLFIMKLGGMMSVGFEKTFLLQNSLNLEASSIVSTYVYELGILNGNYSYAAAAGLFNNIINVILVITANQISKKVAKVSLW